MQYLYGASVGIQTMDYTACFFDLKEECFDELENYLKTRDVIEYVISYEKDPKSHFHLLFSGPKNLYTNLSKHFCDKYNLRRKGKGGTIKYGKVKKIKDLNKMLSYTIKDGNFRSNMEADRIKEAVNNSFKKEKKFTDIKDDIVKYLDSNPYPWVVVSTDNSSDYDWKFKENRYKEIIKYHLKEGIVLKSVSAIKSYYVYYLQKSKELSENSKINYLLKMT